MKFNKLAITSFVLAILGFNLLAAIMGHIALSQIKKKNQRGKGLAISASIIGWLGTLLLVLLIWNPNNFAYNFFYTLGYLWGKLSLF